MTPLKIEEMSVIGIQVSERPSTWRVVDSGRVYWSLSTVANRFAGEKECDETHNVWSTMDFFDKWQPQKWELGDEYPEGFFWTCCKRTADLEEYCEKGPHAGKPSVAQDAKLLEAKWQAAVTEHAAENLGLDDESDNSNEYDSDESLTPEEMGNAY